MADIYYPMLSKTGNESTIAFVNKGKHAVLQYYTSHGHKISKNKTDEVNYLCNTYVLMNTLYEDEQAFIDGRGVGDGRTFKRSRAATLIELHISQHSARCYRHRKHGELYRTTQLLLA